VVLAERPRPDPRVGEVVLRDDGPRDDPAVHAAPPGPTTKGFRRTARSRFLRLPRRPPGTTPQPSGSPDRVDRPSRPSGARSPYHRAPGLEDGRRDLEIAHGPASVSRVGMRGASERSRRIGTPQPPSESRTSPRPPPARRPAASAGGAEAAGLRAVERAPVRTEPDLRACGMRSAGPFRSAASWLIPDAGLCPDSAPTQGGTDGTSAACMIDPPHESVATASLPSLGPACPRSTRGRAPGARPTRPQRVRLAAQSRRPATESTAFRNACRLPERGDGSERPEALV
jgi:hypothetical protein